MRAQMQLDFWNNPIIVSALRVKYRRGAPSLIALAYLMLLITFGVVLHHFQQSLRGASWQTVYLVAVISIQLLLSSLLALQGTAASMQAEVASGTLDFQRIATLSPAQILVGKLLGEPAISYFLAIATIPATMLCMLLGVVSLAGLAIVYWNLVTLTLLAGTLGLQHRLEPSTTKTNAPASSPVIVAAVIGGMILVPAGLSAVVAGAPPVFVAATGLLVPLPIIHGMAAGSPFKHCMPFFNTEIPYAYATPLAQLALAVVLFWCMTRRLHNPLNTTLSKVGAYAVLVVIDVVAAAVLFTPMLHGYSPGMLVASFCLVHLLATLGLTLCVTPRRETLVSWIWRFRGKKSSFVDACLGQRTQNGTALVAFSAIGILVLALLVVLPVYLDGSARPAGAIHAAALLVPLCVVVSIGIGTLYQCFLLVAGRSGAVLWLALVTTLMVVPLTVGEYYDSDAIRAFSPIAHFARWFQREAGTSIVGPVQFAKPPALQIGPVILVYTLLLAYACSALRRRLRQHTRVIDRTIQSMRDVVPGPHNTHAQTPPALPRAPKAPRGSMQ